MAGRVRRPGACDVGRQTRCTGSKIPGPEVAEMLADAASAEATWSCSMATSERMSPKVFSITSTSKLSGLGDELHRNRVDEAVTELDVRVVAGQLGHDAAPHARGREHVCLVDREQPPPLRVRAQPRTRAARRVRPARACTRTCRRRCRPRACRGRRSRGRRRARGRSAGRRRCRRRAAGLRRRQARRAGRSGLASGRTERPSGQRAGRPPSSTARRPRRAEAASVSGRAVGSSRRRSPRRRTRCSNVSAGSSALEPPHARPVPSPRGRSRRRGGRRRYVP